MGKPAQSVTEPGAPRPISPAQEAVESAILEAVRSIRFGSVEVVVHNSQVVQIECRKRVRFQPGSTGTALD
jgi:hypothetical protein